MMVRSREDHPCSCVLIWYLGIYRFVTGTGDTICDRMRFTGKALCRSSHQLVALYRHNYLKKILKERFGQAKCCFKCNLSL